MSRFIARNCEVCGNEFFTQNKEINRGGGRFCSHSCSSTHIHIDNPRSQGNKRLNAIARQIYIDRNGPPICENCGASPADVHHKNEDRRDNSRENQLALCRSCHTTHHNEISPRRQRIQEVLSYGQA